METIILVAVLGFIALSVLISTIVITQQKTTNIIETFGRFSSIRKPGLSFKYPWPISVIAGTINLQVRQLTPEITVKSKDNAFLIIPVKAQFKVSENKSKEAFYELDDPEGQMSSYIVNMIRSKSSELTMEELFSSKDNFENEVRSSLNENFSKYGYQIVDLLVDDPQPSDSLVEEFNNVLAAARKKDAAKNEAEALKIKMVGEAEAEKQSLILKGEAFVAYRAKIAEGNRDAMDVMLGKAEMIADGDGVRFKEIPEKDRKPIDITEKDILDFFAGVDEREAIRSVGKNEGSVVLSTGNSSGGISTDEVIALIKSMK